MTKSKVWDSFCSVTQRQSHCKCVTAFLSKCTLSLDVSSQLAFPLSQNIIQLQVFVGRQRSTQNIAIFNCGWLYIVRQGCHLCISYSPQCTISRYTLNRCIHPFPQVVWNKSCSYFHATLCVILTGNFKSSVTTIYPLYLLSETKDIKLLMQVLLVVKLQQWLCCSSPIVLKKVQHFFIFEPYMQELFKFWHL